MPPDASREQLREWMETWKRAGAELESVRRAELRAIDTAEAVRILFGERTLTCLPPPGTTSGLIEQQAWFAKLRK